MNVILTYFFATEHGDTATDQRKRNAGNQPNKARIVPNSSLEYLAEYE